MVAFNKPHKKFRRLLELRIAQSEAVRPGNYQENLTVNRDAFLLEEALGIEDRELADRLIQSGFHSENIEALHLLPIAMTAWASGSVTAEERDRARQAVFSTGISDKPEATWLYLSWIRDRPQQSLWSLWKDYMAHAKSDFVRTPRFRLQALSVYQVAKRVAFVSGGLLGFGTISRSEQLVLDQLRSAYGMD